MEPTTRKPHIGLRRVRWDEVLRHFDPIQNPAQLDAAVFDKAFGDLMKLVDRLMEL